MISFSVYVRNYRVVHRTQSYTRTYMHIIIRYYTYTRLRENTHVHIRTQETSHIIHEHALTTFL